MMLALIIFSIFCIPAVSARIAGTEKIVGGDIADPNTHINYMVHLTRDNSFTCGASVIAPNYILTAGHCITSSDTYRVVISLYDTNNPSSTDAITLPVAQITNHPNYDVGPGFTPNDIAVLRVDTSISSPPIRLASPGMNFDGLTCTIAGWGKTSGSFFGRTSTLLRDTIGTIQTTAECQQYFAAPGGATDLNICIYNSTSAACNGDSGGPMICNVNGVDYLAGVTSFGHSGCPVTSPSVYTRVTSYYDWIDAQTGGTIIKDGVTPPPATTSTTTAASGGGGGGTNEDGGTNIDTPADSRAGMP